jgi:hydrogenase-4 component B
MATAFSSSGRRQRDFSSAGDEIESIVMFPVLLAIGVLFTSGLLAVIAGRKAVCATALGAGGAVAGCFIGLVPAVSALRSGRVETLRWDWLTPFGSFFLQIDPLSAFFLLPIFGLSIVAAIYGAKYLMAYGSRKNLGGPWFFFNLLVTGMALVVLARNAILFLMAWELMSLASFFLVTFEDDKESVCEAGWTYLVATHLGTAFLLVMFLLLGRQAGSLDFDRFLAASGAIAPIASVVFCMALVGFGTKAGFVPLHVWLPEAHPAAPSHVSALMSGVMIKTGIYGLLRTFTFLGRPDPWWGWALIGIGLASGIGGVLFALAQHDLKRLLAYHSVENIGIIALGLGTGVLGLAINQPVLAVLGLTGGLLHVLNHALFKGLLFLGAGAVIHATGTRDIERLGGLIKRMPWTAAMFLIGSVAICGLPPLNGFVSEFLIYFGAFAGVGSQGVSVWGAATIAGLAMIGALATACFTKAFGVVFLGEPRSDQGANRHEVAWSMIVPMVILAAGCAAIGFLAPQVVTAMKPVIANLTGLPVRDIAEGLAKAIDPLRWVVGASGIFTATLGLLVLLRAWLLAGKEVGASGTWDCGYTRPTARMQYTASSFAQPITNMFHFLLRTRNRLRAPVGFFPEKAALHTETDDVFRRNLFRPTFRFVEWLLLQAHRLQQGSVQVYVLYVAVTLLVLLVWNLR